MLSFVIGSYVLLYISSRMKTLLLACSLPLLLLLVFCIFLEADSVLSFLAALPTHYTSLFFVGVSVLLGWYLLLKDNHRIGSVNKDVKSEETPLDVPTRAGTRSNECEKLACTLISILNAGGAFLPRYVDAVAWDYCCLYGVLSASFCAISIVCFHFPSYRQHFRAARAKRPGFSLKMIGMMFILPAVQCFFCFVFCMVPSVVIQQGKNAAPYQEPHPTSYPAMSLPLPFQMQPRDVSAKAISTGS